MWRRKTTRFWLPAVVAMVALLGAACGGGGDVSQSDYDALDASKKSAESNLSASKAEVTQLRTQLTNMAPVSVVQAGQLAPSAVGAAPTGWDTAESLRGGLNLIATYPDSSSGPDAWDVAAHPMVYFTSEGRGYGHRPSETNELPGIQVIDGNTKTVVASALFDLGVEVGSQPHGLGVSPDGQWVYIGYRQTVDGKRISVTLVINARTLKLDKILEQKSWYEGSMRSQSLHHISAFVDYAGEDRVVLQYGFGATGGPHFLLDPNDDNRVARAITYDDVRPMGHPYLTVDPTGQFLYISMGSNAIRESHAPAAAMAKLDLESGDVVIITEVGHHPIGNVHTSDGKFTYVADGHGSLIYKIDDATNEVVASTSSAVAGPYGLRLSWDETELYVMGKGEGSHNTGGGVGVIALSNFSPTREFNQPIVTGGATIDHGILHPDPSKNELWISSAGTWETIVVDLDTREVLSRIPSPNGGDTHSGAFVRYTSSWEGTLLADHANPGQEMWDTMRAMAAAAAS